MLKLITTALIAVYLLMKIVALAKNYSRARRSGFPVYISPVPSENIVWMVTAPILLRYLKNYLPQGIYDRLDVTLHGWEFRQNGAIFRRVAKTFMLVTPDEVSFWSADPALGKAVLQRRKDFPVPPSVAQFMGIFGSNLLQTNGDEWQRQRRIIAPNLNERISAVVWKTSCEQAQSMRTYMLQNPGNEVLSGLRCLAINVLGRASYGQHAAWTPQLQDSVDESVDARESYFKTVAMVAEKLIFAALVPTWMLKLPVCPAAFRSLGNHIEKMPSYTKQVLEKERKMAADGFSTNDNILSMLVRFSDQAKQSETKASGPSLSLTEDEISGNLFIVSTAGYDTTAHTMGYAVILLAVYPEWQEWMREEMSGLDSNVSQWKYEEVFSKCPRTLAVMHETLRLFTPVLHSLRYVPESQQLVSSDKEVHLLKGPMSVYVSTHSIHADPEIWGPDAWEFKPSRWIGSDGEVITPPSGTFLPWSGGPKGCPGIKISQVEFVAAFLTLFHSSRCEPLAAEGENMEDKRAELKELLKEAVSQVTLTVKDHASVKLRWVTA
ncbi:cytochrome P450 [Aspergillus affinis]|uniref:cytochrome P450 n=1 Tax=Aspergillus affinis TaxID=1070780 RepID=UPI0022FDDE55|nr:uncharacterized protein KD926_003920 [Aspergillus affinis]KAI9046082.1 hypothetical protein KD926_003920 [Aspergillus affinis]